MRISTRARHGLVTMVVIVAAATFTSMALSITGTAEASESSGDIASTEVAFDVVTSNNSGLPCATTPGNQRVVVRGHLTGPHSKLDSSRVEGTLYSHGDGYAEYFWRYPGEDKYNYVEEMGRRGHVSVSIDRLGYGASDKPNGNGLCFGVEADVLHQIVGQLRHGSYQGDRTPRFDRVGLVGHSASGLIADQEAADFHDIDALGVLDSGSLNASPLTLQRAAEQQARCALAPDVAAGLLNPRSPAGYAALEADGAQFRADHIANVEPDIARDLVERRTKDACAGTRNAVQALAGNPVRNNLITVPVLTLTGTEDKLFPHPGLHAASYTQSPRVTVREVPNAGHAVAFARTAPQFHNEMDNWLKSTGL